jgi:hypothetical protein
VEYQRDCIDQATFDYIFMYYDMYAVDGVQHELFDIGLWAVFLSVGGWGGYPPLHPTPPNESKRANLISLMH